MINCLWFNRCIIVFYVLQIEKFLFSTILAPQRLVTFSHIQLAEKELQKINAFKAPREKLLCILNCCKVISNLILNASIAANENPPGADEFLPVLIYVTIKVRSVVRCTQ